jgi:hypothetical protein
MIDTYRSILVGRPCVAMAHNNTYINYSPKRFQSFLLIVSALRIIFFMNARVLSERKSPAGWRSAPALNPNMRRGLGVLLVS